MRRGQVYRLLKNKQKTNIKLYDIACFGDRLLDPDQLYRIDSCVEWTVIISCRQARRFYSLNYVNYTLIILSCKETITISGKSLDNDYNRIILS